MNQKIVEQIAKKVEKELKNESSGHDWWHTWRVWQMARHIGEKESADMFIIDLAALLHDIADWKFHGGDNSVGSKKARKILAKYKVAENIISHVCNIIASMSFEGAGAKSKMKTIEGKVVQDADRLDAIGAIGIARGFMFAGNKNLPMHNPNINYVHNLSEGEYKNLGRKTYTQVNHFYEKLLFLKDLMNTKTAKKIAKTRHEFMKIYLKIFFREWNRGA
jgi:uncharacterized protein